MKRYSEIKIETRLNIEETEKSRSSQRSVEIFPMRWILIGQRSFDGNMTHCASKNFKDKDSRDIADIEIFFATA